MFGLFQKKSLAPVDRRGWFAVVREAFTGAWQANVEVVRDDVLAYHAVFSCLTLIASDISKMPMRMMKLNAKDGIWLEVPLDGYEVLKKPNNYQNIIQFIAAWVTSKLSRGNAYVLKERNYAGKVIRLHVLAPDFVTPLVSESGDVFYQLNADNLAGVAQEGITVPASEIIHDRFNCLFHPLVGLSPIFACGLAATQGLKIQGNSATFFANMSRPSGIITAPGAISDETAARMKEHWESNYTNEKIGKVAVLGDGLKYEAMSVSAKDAEMVEQLKMTAEVVCSTFHVPPYMVGVGAMPTFNNIEALTQQYYSQCLQSLIEAIELCVDEGLEIKSGKGVEFDLDALLRMDSSTQIKTYGEGVSKSVFTPNEARKKLGLPPIVGGDTIYMQQQNYSLEALSERDKEPAPHDSRSTASANDTPPNNTGADDEKMAELLNMISKEFSEATHELV